MVAGLKDQDSLVRSNAAFTLGRIAEKIADKKFLQPTVEPLVAALKDYDADVRNRAVFVFTLGQIGDVRAVEPLMVALKDQDTSVRTNAVDTLSKRGAFWRSPGWNC